MNTIYTSSEFEVLDAGHLMSIAQPDDVNARIRAFFE